MIVRATVKRSFKLLLATVGVAPLLAVSVWAHWMLLRGDVIEGEAMPCHEISAFVLASYIVIGNLLLLGLGGHRLKRLGGLWRLLPVLLFLGTLAVFYFQNFAFEFPLLFLLNLLFTLAAAVGMIIVPLTEEFDLNSTACNSAAKSGRDSK
jgi:hypothetical protein